MAISAFGQPVFRNAWTTNGLTNVFTATTIQQFTNAVKTVASGTLIRIDQPGTYHADAMPNWGRAGTFYFYFAPGVRLTSSGGSQWINDTDAPTTIIICGHGEFIQTNNVEAIYLLQPGSYVEWWGKTLWGNNATNAVAMFDHFAGKIIIRMSDLLRVDGYDIYVNTQGDSFDPDCFVDIRATEWVAPENIFEVTTDFSVSGRCYFEGTLARKLKNNVGSDEFTAFAKNVHARFDTMNLGTNATIKGTHGVLEAREIYSDAGSLVPSILGTMRIVGARITGPTAVDPVSSGVSGALNLIDCEIVSGSSATNSIRAASPVTVNAAGLRIDKPLHDNISISGTITGPPQTNSYAGPNCFINVAGHPQQVLITTNSVHLVWTNAASISGKSGSLFLINNGATNHPITHSGANVRFMGGASNSVNTAKSLAVAWETRGTNLFLSFAPQTN